MNIPNRLPAGVVHRLGRVGVILCCLLGGIAAATFVAGGSQSATPILFDGGESNSLRPASLLEAYDILVGTARRWDGTWFLISLDSQHLGDEPLNAGDDGRRRSWVAVFVNPQGDERTAIFRDGAVLQVLESATGLPGAIAVPSASGLQRPSVDSTVLVEQAFRLIPALRHGEGKFAGVQFGLTREPFVGLERLTVVASLNGLPVRIVFNASGEFVASERLEILFSRLNVSTDGGNTWDSVELPGDPLAATASRASGAIAYVAVSAGGGRGVRVLALDSSLGHRQVSLLEEASWVRAMSSTPRTLYLATDAGLWRIDGRGTSPSRVTESEVIALGWESIDDILFAKVVVRPGEIAGYRVSEGRWLPDEEQSLGTDRIAQLDGRVLSFLRGAGAPGVPPVLDVAGNADGQVAIGADGRSLLFRSAPSGAWSSMRVSGGPNDPVDIEVLPAWPGDRTLLVAEFRGSVWRSPDGGTTWAEVLELSGTFGGMAIARTGQVFVLEFGGTGWVSADY